MIEKHETPPEVLHWLLFVTCSCNNRLCCISYHFTLILLHSSDFLKQNSCEQEKATCLLNNGTQWCGRNYNEEVRVSLVYNFTQLYPPLLNNPLLTNIIILQTMLFTLGRSSYFVQSAASGSGCKSLLHLPASTEDWRPTARWSDLFVCIYAHKIHDGTWSNEFLGNNVGCFWRQGIYWRNKVIT